MEVAVFRMEEMGIAVGDLMWGLDVDGLSEKVSLRVNGGMPSRGAGLLKLPTPMRLSSLDVSIGFWMGDGYIGSCFSM